MLNLNLKSNLLLTSNMQIRLADLGLAILLTKSHASSYVGTPHYMSPEIFEIQFKDSHYYPNTDVW